MVVYVCGTGCQIVVEGDYKLGCAASVEHTPHLLAGPARTTIGFCFIRAKRVSN